MKANLYGDSVKGKDYTHLSPIQQKGVLLHRHIDDYMDNHPAVSEMAHKLYDELPKVSGIALDLYFDHLLAKNWLQFHPTPLADYLSTFYDSITTKDDRYESQFIVFLNKLKDYNWISYYPMEEGLHKACNGVASRLSFPNALVDGLKVFKRHESLISNSFENYMNDAQIHFTQWHLEQQNL